MSGYEPSDDDRDDFDAGPAFNHGPGMMGPPLREGEFDADMARSMTPERGSLEPQASPGIDEPRRDVPFGDDLYDDMARERAGTMSPMQAESSMGSASMGLGGRDSSSLSPSDMDYSDDDGDSPLQGMGGSSLDGSLLNSGFAGGPPQARDHMPAPPPPPATQGQDDGPGVGPSHGGSFDPSMFTTSVSPRPDEDEDDGYY
ncbi:hypothetical protein LTR17_004237 [Elasticomyces elasticus]|nr:hypothetical protein LTR17_004237 [Elasticomyces elasticus]